MPASYERFHADAVNQASANQMRVIDLLKNKKKSSKIFLQKRAPQVTWVRSSWPTSRNTPSTWSSSLVRFVSSRGRFCIVLNCFYFLNPMNEYAIHPSNSGLHLDVHPFNSPAAQLMDRYYPAMIKRFLRIGRPDKRGPITISQTLADINYYYRLDLSKNTWFWRIESQKFLIFLCFSLWNCGIQMFTFTTNIHYIHRTLYRYLQIRLRGTYHRMLQIDIQKNETIFYLENHEIR